MLLAGEDQLAAGADQDARAAVEHAQEGGEAAGEGARAGAAQEAEPSGSSARSESPRIAAVLKQAMFRL